MSSAVAKSQKQVIIAEDDLVARLQHARRELERAEAEVIELKTLAAKLEMMLSLLDDPAFQKDFTVRRSELPQQKDMILGVLSDAAGKLLSVREIRSAVEARYGRKVERTSVSPVLSKLQAAGIVEHVGSAWRVCDA
jgi:repressor of nif and glnA expression